VPEKGTLEVMIMRIKSRRSAAFENMADLVSGIGFMAMEISIIYSQPVDHGGIFS
jgi:hypothetical protein